MAKGTKDPGIDRYNEYKRNWDAGIGRGKYIADGPAPTLPPREVHADTGQDVFPGDTLIKKLPDGSEERIKIQEIPASSEEMEQLQQQINQDMRRDPGMPDVGKSPALAEHARMIASNSSEDAEIAALEKELGVTDSRGQDVTLNAQARAKAERDAKAGQLQNFMDMKAPIPPKVEEGKRIPLNEQLQFSKENTLFQMAGGVADLGQSLVNLGIEVANIAKGVKEMPEEIPHATFADDLFPASDYAGQKVLRGVTQFLVPYAGLSKVVGAAGVTSTIGKAAIAGTLTDFLAFDGNDERLSNLIQTVPALANPITEYLAAKPGDNAIEGRFKNVLEGMGLGLAAEGLGQGLFKTIKFIKESRRTKELVEQTAKVASGEVKALPEGVIEAPPVEEQLKQLEVTPEEALKPGAKAPEEVLTNLDRINVSSEVKNMMTNIANKDSQQIADIVGSPHRLANLDEEAIKSGITVEKVLKKPEGSPLSELESHVLRTAVATRASELQGLAKAALDSGSQEDLAKFILTKNDFVSLFRADKYSAATASRVLGSRRAIVSPINPEQINELVKLYGDKAWKMADMVAQMPPDAIAKASAQSSFRKTFDAVFESYIGNLLSGVGSQAVNLITSPVQFGVNVTRRALAPIFGAGKTIAGEEITKLVAKREELLSKIMDVPFEQRRNIEKELSEVEISLSGVVNDIGVKPSEAAQLIGGFVSGFTDVIRSLGKDVLKMDRYKDAKSFKQLVSEVGSSTKLEHTFQPAIGGNKALDLLGAIQRTSLSALQYVDDAWKVVFNRAELHAVSSRLGLAQNLEGEALQNFVTKTIQNPPPYVSSEGKMFAEFSTFTQPLEGFAKKFDALRNTDFYGAPWLKMVVPFFKTPMNLAAETISTTPIALAELGVSKLPFVSGMVPKYVETLKRGGAEAQLLKSKVLLGNAVFGSAMAFAANGYITGSGPRNKQKRDILEATGIKFNHIKIGDHQFPLSVLGPLGASIGIAADIADIARYSADHHLNVLDNENGPMNAMVDLAGLLSFTVLERSTPEGFTRTMGQLFDSIEQKDLSMFQRIIGNTIPLTGLAKNVKAFADTTSRNKMVDPELSATHAFFIGAVNHWKEQIPGLSSTLPPNRNIFGEEMVLPSPLGVDSVTAFFGVKPRGKNDPLLKELVRLGYYGPLRATDPLAGETFLSINLPEKQIAFGGGIAELDPIQYDKYVQLAAGIGLKDTNGDPVDMPLREALGLAMENYADFNATTDELKRKVLKGTINEYRKMAAQQMLDEFPELSDKIDKSRASFMKARGVEE